MSSNPVSDYAFTRQKLVMNAPAWFARMCVERFGIVLVTLLATTATRSSAIAQEPRGACAMPVTVEVLSTCTTHERSDFRRPVSK